MKKHLATLGFLLTIAPFGACGSAGVSFQATAPADPAEIAVAKTALADQLTHFESEFVAVGLPVGRRAAFVRATSGAVCGDVGCPSALLLWSGAGWSAAWTGV